MKPFSQSHLQPCNLFHKFSGPILLSLFLVVVSLDVIESGSVVKTLPGFPGDLPFTLETGYSIAVIQYLVFLSLYYCHSLFYYFIESEGNPKNDPLMLWLTGGPGSSVLGAIMYEIGPFTINNANSTWERQMLQLKPYSWTKAANIIFVDQPAGSGFSYAKTPEAYMTNDTFATMHGYQFIRKWLVDHPMFLNNSFYVGGDSYGGILVATIVQDIYNGNQVGERPHINIKGYVLGNAGTDTHDEFNSRIRYAHKMALLSDTIYKSTKENCHGEYLNVDTNNTLCVNDLQAVDKCLGRIFVEHILEPICDTPYTIKYDIFRRGLRSIDNDSMHIWPLPQVQNQACRVLLSL
ncbi:hypothetical protein LXL04_000086 [Taraxacum kok-saghyz]